MAVLVELEKQKRAMGDIMEEKTQEIEKQYQEAEEKANNILEMIKQSKEEKIELHRSLNQASRNLEFTKTHEKDEYDGLLQMKLNSVMEAFKIEVEKPDKKWLGERNLRCITRSFEEVLNIISENEPCFEQLVRRLLSIMNVRNENDKVCKFPLLRNIHVKID